MGERHPVNMTQPPRSSVDALAILDFQMGDEWAGLTTEYAMRYIDEAIQILERLGMIHGLPGRYQAWIHSHLWKQD